jgi:hypothetical protein
LLLALGCAGPEPVAAPQAAAPPSSAWYSPRNWFRRIDSDGAPHKEFVAGKNNMPSGAVARKPAADDTQPNASDASAP